MGKVRGECERRVGGRVQARDTVHRDPVQEARQHALQRRSTVHPRQASDVPLVARGRCCDPRLQVAIAGNGRVRAIRSFDVGVHVCRDEIPHSKQTLHDGILVPWGPAGEIRLDETQSPQRHFRVVIVIRAAGRVVVREPEELTTVGDRGGGAICDHSTRSTSSKGIANFD